MGTFILMGMGTLMGILMGIRGDLGNGGCLGLA